MIHHEGSTQDSEKSEIKAWLAALRGDTVKRHLNRDRARRDHAVVESGEGQT